MSASWINLLNTSDSRLHKEDVIKKALSAATLGSENAQMFLRMASLCYNPFETFGIRQIPDTVGITDAENPWKDFEALLYQLTNRELTGNAARDAVQAMANRFDSTEWNIFCAAILRRDLRAGTSDKTINKICKKTEYVVPSFGCQLAASGDGRPEMRGIKRLEPKLDGSRMLMLVNKHAAHYSITCYSRNGKVFENFGHIEDQILSKLKEIIAANSRAFENGFVLDGEVIGKSFQELMRQARRKTNVQATDSVFSVFDILPAEDFERGYWNATLAARIKLLDALRPTFDTLANVELLPHIMVDLDTAAGKNQMHRYAQDTVNAGFEGIMIKDPKAPYECTRSTFWMKWKPVYDYDLKVVAIEEGSGKHAGRMGALVCEGIDQGKHIRVNVGSGFTDEERQSYWDNQADVIGQTAVIMCDAITQNQNGSYSLRFPRFKTFREDK